MRRLAMPLARYVCAYYTLCYYIYVQYIRSTFSQHHPPVSFAAITYTFLEINAPSLFGKEIIKTMLIWTSRHYHCFAPWGCDKNYPCERKEPWLREKRKMSKPCIFGEGKRGSIYIWSFGLLFKGANNYLLFFRFYLKISSIIFCDNGRRWLFISY